MKKKLLELITGLQTLFSTHEKSLNALLASAPEADREAIKTAQTGVAGRLKSLLALCDIPDETEKEKFGEWAGSLLAVQVDHVREVTGLNQTLGGRVVQLNAAIAGDYVRKDEHKQLVETARKDGEKAGRDGVLPMVTEMRKQAVLLASLPEAPAEVLALPSDEYTARFTTAQATVASCGKRGLDPKHITTGRLAWQPQDKVLCELKELDALGLKEKTQTPEELAAAAKEEARLKALNIDPLKGGGLLRELPGEVLIA